MLARVLAVAIVGLMAMPAAAQDDDLAPLVPIPDKRPKKVKHPKKVKRVKHKTADDDLAPLVVAKTRLDIKLAKPVSDAEVSIDGKPVGTFPLEPQDVKPGEHTISVKRPGYAHFSKQVRVRSGKTVDVTCKLEAVAAVVSVTGAVDGADVLFGGKMLGLTPLHQVEVPPGTGELVVHKEGFKDESQILTLVAGKDYPLTVDLTAAGATTTIVATSDRPETTNLTPETNLDEPPPLTTTTHVSNGPITTKWYFWAGVGAVAVAIIAGTAVGVSSASKPPTNGQIERQVCEGECYACLPTGWCDGPVAPAARASSAGAGIVHF